VNGESGNTQDGTVDGNELRDESACVFSNDDPSGQGKISVEPGVPDSATVSLHTHLEIRGFGTLRDRADLIAL
jgi:hypothetical protein